MKSQKSNPPSLKNSFEGWILFFLFLTGFKAILTGMVWMRWLTTLTHYFLRGSSLFLMTLLLGFILGGFYWGRRMTPSKKHPSPLSLYAYLEFGIAFLSLLTPFFLKVLKKLTLLIQNLPIGSPSDTLEVLLLSSPILLPFSWILGGILIVLTSSLSPHEKREERGVGRFFGWMGIGMGMGTLLSGFLMFRTLGLFFTHGLSVLLSILMGTLALLLNKRYRPYPPPSPHLPHPSLSPLFPLYFLIGTAGFLLLGVQWIWTGILTFFTGSTPQDLSLLLTIFVSGFALGSFLSDSIMKRFLHTSTLLGWISSGMGLSLLLTIPFMTHLFFLLFSSQSPAWSLTLWEKGLSSFLVLFPPAFLTGLTVSLVIRIFQRSYDTGRSIGNLLTTFSIGGLFGNFVVGTLLIQIWGYQKSLQFFGVLLFLACPPLLSSSLKWKRELPSKILLSLLLLILISRGSLFREKRSLSMTNHRFLKGKSLTYREGSDPIVEVVDREGEINLFLHGERNASTSIGGLRIHRLLSLLPLLLHENPKEILLFPLGSGMTAGALRSASILFNIERIDCRESSREMVKASEEFKIFNREILQWKKFHLLLEKRREPLLSKRVQYDLILSGFVLPKSTRGMRSFYHVEGYSRIKKQLRERGIFCQWLSLDDLRQKDFKMILKTFLKTFPYTTLWLPQPFGEGGSSNIFLIGSLFPLSKTLSQLEAKIRSLNFEFQSIGIFTSLDLLDSFLAGEGRLRSYLEDIPLVKEDRPSLEYSPVGKDEVKILEDLLHLRENPWFRFKDGEESLREEVERRYQIVGICMEGDIQKLKGNTLGALWSYRKAKEALLALSEMKRMGTLKGIRESIEREISSLEAIQEKVFEEAISRKFEEHLLLGYLYQKEGEVKKAREEYEKVLAEDPHHSIARFNLALIYQEEKNYEKALKEFYKILKDDPSHSDALMGLGTTYLLLGENPMALSTLEEAHKAYPKDPTLLYNLGEIYWKVNDVEKARESWEKALLLDPHNAKIHSALGSLFANEGHYESAEIEYLLALKSDPMDHQTLGNLGILYAQVGDRHSSLQMLERALKIDPMNSRLKAILKQLEESP